MGVFQSGGGLDVPLSLPRPKSPPTDRAAEIREREGEGRERATTWAARSLGRRAADGAIANDAITNFARRSGERGGGQRRRRERDSGQPWWSVNESTNDD